MTPLPEVHWGTAEKSLPELEDIEDGPDDDEELAETPADVVDMLGFDPLDINEGEAMDAGWNESDHPRGQPDNAGKFGAGGGGGASKKPDAPALDPEVAEVGGDPWNKESARHLETEYQSVKPKMDKVLAGVNRHLNWADVSEVNKVKVKAAYKEQHLPDALAAGKDVWLYSGEGSVLLTEKVNEFFGSSEGDAWVVEKLTRYDKLFPGDLKDNSVSDVAKAFHAKVPEGGYDAKFQCDDEKLTADLGSKAASVASFLSATSGGVTSDFRKILSLPDDKAAEIESNFETRFDRVPEAKKSEFVESNVPDVWEEHSTETLGGTQSVKVYPDKYDPLNKTAGKDYKLTQALGAKVFKRRALEIVTERKILGKDGKPITAGMIAERDDALWGGWVESSTSQGGKAIQIAVAEELGGKLRSGAIDAKEVKEICDVNYPGGFDLVKALVRAKWETTQALLERADIKTLDLYRAVALSPDLAGEAAIVKNKKGKEFRKLGNLEIGRNGAASTSTDIKVCNGWGKDKDRVVLRTQVPRTSVVSIPAFGQNDQGEHEVVIAGTASHGWDAWVGSAPSFKETPFERTK